MAANVDNLDLDRLLANWRWLCPTAMSLVARNVFGELFLADENGKVFWLNVTVGTLTQIAGSLAEFHDLAATSGKRKEWFVEFEAKAYAQRALQPSASQCIGFGVPAMFAGGGTPDTAYLADLYEHVSFLGDLHRQLCNAPDGTKVQLQITPPKPVR